MELVNCLTTSSKDFKDVSIWPSAQSSPPAPHPHPPTKEESPLKLSFSSKDSAQASQAVAWTNFLQTNVLGLLIASSQPENNLPQSSSWAGERSPEPSQAPGSGLSLQLQSMDADTHSTSHSCSSPKDTWNLNMTNNSFNSPALIAIRWKLWFLFIKRGWMSPRELLCSGISILDSLSFG